MVVNAYGPTDMHRLYDANATDAEIEELADLYTTSLSGQELISTRLGEENSMSEITRRLVRNGMKNVLLGEGEAFRSWFKQKVDTQAIDGISLCVVSVVFVPD